MGSSVPWSVEGASSDAFEIDKNWFRLKTTKVISTPEAAPFWPRGRMWKSRDMDTVTVGALEVLQKSCALYFIGVRVLSISLMPTGQPLL